MVTTLTWIATKSASNHRILAPITSGNGDKRAIGFDTLQPGSSNRDGGSLGCGANNERSECAGALLDGYTFGGSSSPRRVPKNSAFFARANDGRAGSVGLAI